MDKFVMNLKRYGNYQKFQLMACQIIDNGKDATAHGTVMILLHYNLRADIPDPIGTSARWRRPPSKISNRNGHSPKWQHRA